MTSGFTIAYQDEHLLVIDKAPGLVVHPARGHREGTLAQLLAPLAAGGEPGRAGIVHRLDRDTSGLLVVSRSDEAHRLLQTALAERRIEREYVSLVEGRPPARTGTIEAPIGRDPRIRTRMTVGGLSPREARTHFTLDRALPSTSLLRLHLDTGRTHQIRVHLTHLGHPLIGDPSYGRARQAPRPKTPAETVAFAVAADFSRQALHAFVLGFQHPSLHKTMRFESPWPSDFALLVEALRGLNGG